MPRYTKDASNELREARVKLEEAWQALFRARQQCSEDQDSFDFICKAMKQRQWAEQNVVAALTIETRVAEIRQKEQERTAS